MEWFASKGAGILRPHGHSPDYDFVADLGDRFVRVQVKTCISPRLGRWPVSICTRGGNQSWSGLVKRFDQSRCDYLFILVGNGRRWCLPAEAIEGTTRVTVGGPKYSEYEVEPGHPLPPRTDDEPASTIVSLDPRGDVRAAKGDRL